MHSCFFFLLSSIALHLFTSCSLKKFKERRQQEKSGLNRNVIDNREKKINKIKIDSNKLSFYNWIPNQPKNGNNMKRIIYT